VEYGHPERGGVWRASFRWPVDPPGVRCHLHAARTCAEAYQGGPATDAARLADDSV